MRTFLFSLAFLVVAATTQAQETTAPKLYNPEADAKKDLQAAIAKAAKENKHVLIQAGGNWCVWCLRFEKYVKDDQQIDSLMNANYVVYHLNYSNENKNSDILARYEYPQRFGFPVFIILDATGKRIHTQNSAYLEENSSYSKKKVVEFFNHWKPVALKAASYNY